jgi:hypothetical protein
LHGGPKEPFSSGLHTLAVSATSSEAGCELWARVIGPDGEFVEGIRPVDFFVFSSTGDILDFLVERPPAARAVTSVRLVYPVALGAPFARGIMSEPLVPAWALAGYGNPADTAADKAGDKAFAQPVFRLEPQAIVSAFASFEPVAKTAAEACRAALAVNRGVHEQHLAVFLDEGPHPGLDLAALRADCGARGIRLHSWRIGQPAAESAERLMAAFTAALRNRYVVRTRAGEPAGGYMVRDSDSMPPRFSRRADLILPGWAPKSPEVSK